MYTSFRTCVNLKDRYLEEPCTSMRVYFIHPAKSVQAKITIIQCIYVLKAWGNLEMGLLLILRLKDFFSWI